MFFLELYADRSFDYRSYLMNCGVKVPARLIDLCGSVIKYFPKPNEPEKEFRVKFKMVIRITLDDVYFNKMLSLKIKLVVFWTQQ